MTTLYPNGYGTSLVPLAELRRIHSPKMHPEFSRRIWPWLESMDGLIGIGGGWRLTQPDKDGVAPEGKSFHQYQTFASGIVAYCAVDLVAKNPGHVHRAPTWGESQTAPDYGLHTFITGEPWHLQPAEIRGWQTWVNAGRPDPDAAWPLPGDDMPAPLPVSERLFDSRTLGGKVQPGQVITIDTKRQGVLATVNITATDADGNGYVTAWKSGEQPATSNVPYRPGEVTANLANVGLDGSKFRFSANVAATHVVVDLQTIFP